MFNVKRFFRAVLMVVLAIGVAMSCKAAQCSGEAEAEAEIEVQGSWVNGECKEGGTECTLKVKVKGQYSTSE